MIAAGMLAGAGIAIGLLFLVAGFVPRRPELSAALGALLDPPRGFGGAATSAERSVDWRPRVAERVARGLAAGGKDVSHFEADLRLVGRTVEEHLVEKAIAAVTGFALPPTTVVVLRLAGTAAPLSLAFVGAIALAIGGFVLPDLLLRSQASERRRAFRYALSSYLDLTHIVLAAGAGVETALAYAADAGDGWAFTELRGALRRSRLSGQSPWVAFGRLGEELDIPELREVSSSLALAGAHGARVRASLEARAAALRSRDLAEMHGEAEAATERMALPSVLMVVGFVIFVGFPAIHEILGF